MFLTSHKLTGRIFDPSHPKNVMYNNFFNLINAIQINKIQCSFVIPASETTFIICIHTHRRSQDFGLGEGGKLQITCNKSQEIFDRETFCGKRYGRLEDQKQWPVFGT